MSGFQLYKDSVAKDLTQFTRDRNSKSLPLLGLYIISTACKFHWYEKKQHNLQFTIYDVWLNEIDY